MANVTVIIPTYNEETNIADCIKSLDGFAEKIILMDNNSTDKTKEIAEGLGAKVIQSETSYKERLNTGITLPEISTVWVMNVDADERLTPDSKAELCSLTEKYLHDPTVNGIVLRYRFVFMGKLIRHSRSNKMRLFKKGKAFMENVELDEHFVLREGRSCNMKHSLLHIEYKGIDHLTRKMNEYALRKAKEVIEIQKKEKTVSYEGLASVTKKRRYLNYNLYYKLPIALRAKWYYIYVYYLHLRFLEGGPVTRIYYFIRVYWYKMLTDAYIKELQLLEEGKLIKDGEAINIKKIDY